MAGGQGGNGANQNGTGGQGGADEVGGIPGDAGGNGGSSNLGSGGGGGGGSGGVGGAGGLGGAAAGGTVANSGGAGGTSTVRINGVDRGGDGGVGLNATVANNGGGGGGGGAIAYYEVIGGGSNLVTNRVGGNGGNGGFGLGAGGGGAGGAGGYGFVANGPGNFPSSADLTGGNGGSGGAAGGPGAVGGAGGSGGVGIFLSGNNIFTTSGIIRGGDGGLGGAGNGGTQGAAGLGGAGIRGSNIGVVNTGSISGGVASAGGGARADAIDFTGGTNSLTPGTGALNGGIGITGTLRVLGANTTLGNVIHDSAGGAGSLIKDDGGSLTLTGANTYSGSTSIAANNTLALAGSGSIANSSGVANAGTFDISATTAGASVSTLSGNGATNLGAQTLSITNGSTSYGGTVSGTGGLAINGGTQALTGANTYSGGTALNGGTLQLGGASAAGTGPITFASLSGNATARLGLDLTAQPTNGTFSNTIANFGSGNEIALAGLTNSNVSYNSANSSITVTGTRSGGGQVSESFVLSAPRTTSFTAVSDGQGNTIIRAAPPSPVPCYVTGTAILTARGSVAVEALAVGDVVVTAAGAHRPIRWIGRRGYDGLSAPRADRPVRVRAGALGDGVPARDLRVSPDHALMVEGLFVAAGHLVNGTSITRGEPVADLTYWHVELDSHDLLVAEGAPAESFLPAAGLRGRFADAQADALADAQADGQAGAGARAAPEPYAPRVAPGPALAALRARLNARAGLAAAMPGPGALRGSLDLCELRGGDLRVAGWARDAVHAAGPVCLDIVVDGAVAATVLAEVARPDLVAAGEGGGRHGFDVGLGMAELGGLLAPGRPHTVAVRRTADRAPLGLMRLDAAGLWSPAQVA
jgi:hypothetical protein